MFRSANLNVERRRAARVSVVPYRVRLGRDEGYLVNISEVGALVRVARPQRPDQEVRVDFDVSSEHLSIPARVVRCTAQSISLNGAVLKRQEYCVAFEFRVCGPDERRFLRRIIEGSGGQESGVRTEESGLRHPRSR